MPPQQESTVLPTKTPGRSRRKKPTKTPGKATRDKENDDGRTSKSGENGYGNGSSRPALDRFPDDQDVENISLNVASEHASRSSGSSKDVQRQVAHEFRQLLRRVSVSSDLFQDPDNLVENIVRASLSQRYGDHGGIFLQLDQHHSALLSFARKLIKEAAEKVASKSKHSLAIDNLKVAMYILRAVAFSLAGTMSVDKTEALLKLFYHLIATAGDVSGDEICAGFIAISGYDGLGHVLSRTRTKQIAFRLVYHDEKDDNAERTTMFAIPSQSDGKSTKGSSLTEINTSIRQLCTIALKTTALVAKILCILSMPSSQQNQTKASNQLVGYGSLADMVGQQQHGLHDLAIDVFQQVHTRWVTLLGRVANSDKEAMKELLSYSKGAHHLLWDTASKLKAEESTQSKKSSDTGLNLENVCLSLRKHAILLLLPQINASKIDLLVRKTSLASCCTHAWKAASVFCQQDKTDSSKRVITAFYEDIDVRIRSFLDMSSSIPLEYMEYFAYHSLHTQLYNALPCLQALFEGAAANDIAREEVDIRTVLSVLKFALCCKARIDFVMNGGSTTGLWGDDKRKREAVVDLLQSQLVVFDNLWTQTVKESSLDAMKRIFKVFSGLSMQKTLFAVVKGESATTTALATELEIASRILGSLGNLGVHLIESDPDKVPQLLDLTFEFYIRPLSVCEKVSEAFAAEGCNESAIKFANVADHMTATFYDTIVRLHQELSVVTHSKLEKAAKLFATTSRHRRERSMESNSLLPSLYSLKLYLILETRGCDREDLQITQRLMLLSGILETLGRENDAFFIGCFALKREALKFFSNEICEKDILNFLANQTDGILPLAAQAPALSNEAFSICRRMSNLLISSGIDTFSSQWKTLPNTPTLESFLDSRIELFRHCKELHASPGMMLAIQGIFNCDDLLRDDWRIGCFFLLVEVSSMLGKAIASRSSDQNENPEDIELLLLRYSELITTLHNLIESFHNMRKASFHSLLDLTASASLSSVSGRRWIASTPSWLESCNFRVVEKATKIASDAISNCNLSEDSMLCSCHLATHTLLLAMGVQSIEEAFENSVEAIRSIIEATTNEEETDGPVLAKRWAMWCGSHVLDQIEHRGDKEKVAALSMWLIALPDDETKFSLWFHSSLLSSCADENNRLCVTKSYAKVAANLPTNTAQRGNALWIFETELTLCRIQADILNSNNHLEFSYQEMESDLERIEEEINGSEQPDEGLFLLQHWLLSTLHFVRADLASAFGQFPLALKATQECLRHCQIIMKNRNLLKQESHCMTSELATTSIIERARSRYIQVLIKRPKLHYHLGDHRKADAYVRSLLNFLNFDSYDENPHGSHSNALKELAGLLNNAPEVRLILKIMGWASTPDQATNDLACDSTDFSIHGNQDDSENCVVDSIQNLISVGDILYGDSITSSFKQAFLPFYSEAIKNMAETTRLAKFLSFGLPSQMQDFVGDTLSKHVELRNARLFLETNQSFDGASDMAVQQACLEIDKDELSRSEDKAWALYYLGILELNQARRTGSLQRLWQDFDDSREEDEPCTHLLNAKDYLSRALLHVVNSSDVLIRNILRSLALASGPSVDGGIGMSSGILVLTSIGQSLRRRMTWSFQNSSESSHGLENDERVNFFETFDGPFTESRIRDDKIWKLLQAFGDTVSPHWNFIAPVICPSGEMLITKIAKNELYDEFVVSTECIFPPEGKTSYDCIVAPLDSILQKMHGQLHHIKPDLSIENTDKDAVKREWWDMRGQLDDEMASLLEEVEAQFFSQAFAQKDFLPRGNLVSKFDEIFDNANILLTSHREERANKLKSLTVPVLKEKLIDAGVQESNLKTLRKMELIDLLIDTEDASNDGSEYSQDDDTCLFLILDENLQRFPFEGMPVLQGKAVCRVPCLTFVLAKLYELGINQNESPELDPANTSFVLDPERNLQGTRKRILPVVEELQSERNWGWNAVIGNMPSTEFFEMGLTKSKSLFMYFGHGGAQLCFSRRRVEELITQRVTMLCEQKGGKACEASVVLMGCSSGRLESINRKNSNLIEETPLYYEPGGVALSYLCAGAPCVVGNLWDVTDHDIDRFSISLLHHFLDGASVPSLPRSVCLSRSACKLKYLVGCAPVCYGLPVFARTHSRHQSRLGVR